MKLMSTGNDPLGVDPRTRGTPKPSSDGSSSDKGPQFDGVLSDVGSDAKAAAATDGAKMADATSAVAAFADSTGAENTIMGALIDILGKGAGVAATQGAADAKGGATEAKPDTDTTAGDAVDSLLKKIAAKDSDAADAQATAAGSAAPAGTGTDVMSILLLGAGLQQAPQAAQLAAGTQATVAAGTQAAVALGTVDPRAKTTPGEPSASTDAKEMIVTDIAVSTHLAPAQTGSNTALLASDTAPSSIGDAKIAPAGDAKSAPKVGTGGKDSETSDLSSSSASPPHGHADDVATSGHTAEPAVGSTSMTTAAMGASLAPVRSIAAAIGELAAPAAPVVATPEAPKAPIGIARTMTLQMNPENLGTVDIRLHVTGQSLDVQLTISNSQTLGIVNRDREALTSALHDQNYALNSLVIQDGAASASSGGNNGTQGDSSGSNARADRQAGGAGSDTQGGGRQGSGADRPSRDDRRPSRDTPTRAPVAAESRAGSLYV